MNEFSNSIPDKLNKDVKIKSDKIKINIVKKYLLISLKSKLIFVNINLFIKIFLGRLKERIWFIEYLNNEYNLINLNPELVEKKEPPIITNIKKISVKFFYVRGIWGALSLILVNPIKTPKYIYDLRGDLFSRECF